MNTIRYLSPSYKRPTSTKTHKWLSDIEYVVCESQAAAYRAVLPEKNLLICPDSAQGNLCRIRNWILDNCGDSVVLLDDDNLGMYRWKTGKRTKMTEGEFKEFCEDGFQLAEDIGTPMWGVNIMPDKLVYNEHRPFSITNVVLGPFQAFHKMDLRYDEALPLKEDYDLSLQVLNKYRKLLRINYVFYNVDQHTNTGGCADYRTIAKEKQQFKLLQKKWGSKIVREDTGKSNADKRKKDVSYDINPRIVSPIKGT